MNIIVCIDNKNGMMFNKKRQSRDRKLIEDIINSIKFKICMNKYSSGLFLKYLDQIIIDENFLTKYQDYYCFVENDSLKDFENKINTIIIYKWNRDYPADLYLNIDLNNYDLIKAEEFPGYSHEKITKEIYKRKG